LLYRLFLMLFIQAVNKITFNMLRRYVLLILYKIKRHQKGDKKIVNLLNPTGYVMHQQV